MGSTLASISPDIIACKITVYFYESSVKSCWYLYSLSDIYLLIAHIIHNKALSLHHSVLIDFQYAVSIIWHFVEFIQFFSLPFFIFSGVSELRLRGQFMTAWYFLYVNNYYRILYLQKLINKKIIGMMTDLLENFIIFFVAWSKHDLSSNLVMQEFNHSYSINIL